MLHIADCGLRIVRSLRRPRWLGQETGHNEGSLCRPRWLGQETGHNEGSLSRAGGRPSLRLAFWLVLALAAAGAARAVEGQAARSGIASFPPRVVEREPFTLVASYSVPAGSAKLHCEMQNTRNMVLAGQVVTVSGSGKHEFTLRAPAIAAEAQITAAVWLGEDWREPLAPIVHTPTIRVVLLAEQRRLEQMKADVTPTLERLGYRRSGKGNVALLDDDLPGVERALANKLAEALGKRGIAVTRISAEALANPYLLSRDTFDLLLLPDSRVFPADARAALEGFVAGGGDLVALNGPAFSRLVWRLGGRWVDKDGAFEALADSPGRRVFLDFEKEDASAWKRETNDPGSPAPLTFDGPGAGGTSRSAHISITNLTGWDTFASPHLESPFPTGHTLTCFWARGDGQTSQLSVEWRERDGSRWIAVLPLAAEWKRYALPPGAFRYWHDSASKSRGGEGDRFRPENAERILFGLAFTHTNAVGPGRHEIRIDEVASAPMPETLSGAEEILQGTPSVPVLEGVSPGYKLYPITSLKRLETAPRQVLWRPGEVPMPSATLAPHPRPQGTGFGKNRRWRFMPLLEAVNSDGKVAGAPAALIMNGKAPYEGALCLSVPVTDRGFLEAPGVISSVAGVVQRMLEGVFLYEGGARAYAYRDGEKVDLGAEVCNFGRQSATTRVGIAVLDGAGRKPLFRREFPVTVAAGERKSVEAVWSPARFERTEYLVQVSLRRGKDVTDTLRHPLSIWRPSPKPQFMATRGGDFVLGGRKWYPHGVNYMPSSGVGVDDGEYFEYWLDPQPYDPDVVERDLEDIRAIGMNMVSVFIYHRSRDSRNLLDLLLRCRRHGLKVNLSLRPGTPMDFRWDEMRELIDKHRLAEEDVVFAYDLAWEPSFGGFDARKPWDREWEQWIGARYGALDAAEKAWGFAVPRAADGKVTGPSDAQVAQSGEWTKMAAAYRRFVDDLLHRKYGEARRLVRGVDPNHLVSFRMSVAGDPTCGQGWIPYDFRGLNGAVDILCPEGYGRIGDWERVKPGWFTAAYARCVAPETPVMWAEFGTSIWDHAAMAPSEKALKFEAEFYRDFYQMALRSGANGTVCWWFPGGFRVGENSDYGIQNPDRTWRPATRVIHDYAKRMTAERRIPTPNVILPVHRDAHANGIQGVYAELQEAFWKAVSDGKTPGLKWVEGETK